MERKAAKPRAKTPGAAREASLVGALPEAVDDEGVAGVLDAELLEVEEVGLELEGVVLELVPREVLVLPGLAAELLVGVVVVPGLGVAAEELDGPELAPPVGQVVPLG